MKFTIVPNNFPARTISDNEWEPEDNDYWERIGAEIAWRNLWIILYVLFLSFAVWQIWTLTVVYLPAVGFGFTDAQLFILTAIPPLVGGLLRLVFIFGVPWIGGRRFNAFATATFLIPAIGLAVVVQNPETPFWIVALLAGTAGFGGAAFSSMMDHISYFFPEDKEGLALAITAGPGNAGVSAAQFLVPILVTTSIFAFTGGGVETSEFGTIWIQSAGYFWVPLVLIGVVACWFGLNDLEAMDTDASDQLVVWKRKHNWVLSILYMGTLGSFLGYATAFPLLTGITFPERDVAVYAFIGPLIAALIRVPGGSLSDRVGGGNVSLAVFASMALGSIAVIVSILANSFWGFFASFIFLFIACGIGNASVFEMVPKIFRNWHVRKMDKEVDVLTPQKRKEASRIGDKEGGAVLGFSGGIGALGGFLIPQGFSSSVEATGSGELAMGGFFLFYVLCFALVWYYYKRDSAEVPVA